MTANKIKTACIIDDDIIFIYGTTRIMNDCNFCDDIIVYNNGQDAFDGLTKLIDEKSELPEVIFLDLNMPIMNGWEFLEDFTKMPVENAQNITIFVISSSVDPRDLERIHYYKSVSNYILKPISPKDLTLVIEAIKGI